MERFVCNKCGGINLYIDNRGNQKALMCADCKAWIKWISKKQLPVIEEFINSKNKKAEEEILDIDIENFRGKIFKHFKGKLYLFLDIVEHSETGEQLVLYKALYGKCKVYVRPKEMFFFRVDKNKHPFATQEYRFELVEV